MAIGKTDSRRVFVEDALKHLLDCEEGGGGATVDSLSGALGWRRARATEVLGQLRSRGLADLDGGSWRLSEDGRQYAVQVLRTHRLYETYLARETGVPASDWHRRAHAAEHHLDAEQVDRLADRLSNPRFDPHGDPIPTREGQLPSARRVSLAEWRSGEAIIEHIEDEPEEVFRRIRRLGLHPGMRVGGFSRRPGGGVRLSGEGREVEIPAECLGMIHLAEVGYEDELDVGARRLSEVALGEEVVVHALSPSCIGAERRRLLDLGLVPGTRIRAEFDSPFGSPRSYFIRGTMIALRREQAEKILVESAAAIA